MHFIWADNLNVLGQVDHSGQRGNANRTRIREEMSETDHTLKRRFCVVLFGEP